ncbi:MAG TPA: PQQ-binding-like beta-propeller repeat protein [Cyclobacteriaceae bacterium]|nr:PQQ-binding-like beta-propeller repeat protein [Cyclobacteriaceae bacterium]
MTQLKTSWVFEVNDMPPGSRPGLSQNTPIMVNGVLYSVSAKGLLYALNAKTGEQLWSFDPFNGGEGGGTVRGVSYWENGNDNRIIFGSGHRLFAVNAQSGKKIVDFGAEGYVDLRIGLRDDPKDLFIALTSPGIIFKDLIIVGGRLQDLYDSPPGYIRAYDCRTGKLVWTFHTIPLPGEPGYETWPKEAYKTAGGANNWAGMSLDAKRDMVFVSLGSPSYDFYGADRLGENLYGNCVLALKASTGEYVWHYQTVHHDLWDYDLPAPPNLVTINRDGEKIDAVAQITKQGFVFVLDRETGKPLFPIEDRQVPPSYMPGEEAWPTQPFPLLPKPYARQSFTEADIANYSKESHAALLQKFRSLRYEGMFTPPDLRGTLIFPGTRGGAQWGGAAFDPETSMLYIRSMDAAELITIVEEKTEIDENTSLAVLGASLYSSYCASCHGVDKKGTAPFPSLENIGSRLSKESISDKIMKGVGMMPGYASVFNKQQQEAIVAYMLNVGENSKVVETNVLEKTPGNVRYLNTTGYTTWVDSEGRPAMTPPWGTLNALNLSTGEYEWQIPLGNDETFQQDGAPPTGLEGKSGPVVTAGGLIFISGAEDKKLRAIDKKTGNTLWETTLPAMANATACTYSVDGKQFIVISVGGTEENPSGFIMAFSLP